MYNRKQISLIVPLALILISLATGAAKAAIHEFDCAALLEGVRARLSGQNSEAITSLEKNIFEQGDMAAAYLHLGLNWELKGELSKARLYYERALNERPDYICAHYYLNRLDTPGGFGSNENSTINLVTSPENITDNFPRYRGKRVLMKGELMCWPCTKGPRPLLLVSSNSLRDSSRETDSTMDGVFIVKLSKPLPDDPRIRRGAKVEIKGRIVDRDFAWNPYLKVFSARKKPVLKGEHLVIENNKGYTGPLNLAL